VLGESLVLVEKEVLVHVLDMEVKGGSVGLEGGGDWGVSLVDDFVLGLDSLSPGGVDSNLDVDSILNAWESLSDVHALGLADWEVLTILGLHMGAVHVPCDDEASLVLDTDLAGLLGLNKVPWLGNFNG